MIEQVSEINMDRWSEHLRSLKHGGRSPAEVSAHFVILHLARRHGMGWLSGPRSREPRMGEATGAIRQLEDLGLTLFGRVREKLIGLESFSQICINYFLKGVVLDSHEGLVGWLEARYPLEVRYGIPSPEEMLNVQCEGRRLVTLLLEPDQQFVAYGRHRDACDFLLHDFEHAHKFFADPHSHRGQVRFFNSLRKGLRYLQEWNADARFRQDLDYLMSDMNSHPVHLMKYLKAIVLTAEMRRSGNSDPELDGFWRELFSEWGMVDETLDAALKLNRPEQETPVFQAEVAEFFMRPDSACPPAPRTIT